jgi:hypothetical protein
MRQRNATVANVAAGWIGEYKGEVDVSSREALTEQQIQAGKRRRRIEDIREAARLERGWQEVWEGE